MANERSAVSDSGRDSPDSPERKAEQAGRDAKDEAKRQASAAKDEVKEKARDATHDVRERAERKMDEGRHSLAESATALASALDAAAGSLSERNQERLSDWSRDAGERVRRMASYLERNDTDGLMHNLEDTARDNPTAFVGTSLAAGLAAGRFLRSSRPTQPEVTGQGRSESGPRRYQVPTSRENVSAPGLEPGGYAAGPPQGTATSQPAGYPAGRSARTSPDRSDASSTGTSSMGASSTGPRPDTPPMKGDRGRTRDEGGAA